MKYQGLDNQRFCHLPEGVSIQIIPAGIAVRASAYLYDFFIRAACMLCIFLLLKALGEAGKGLTLVVYFFLSWGYYIYFEGVNGQTPGKKRFKLKVVQDNGLPVTLSNVIIRNLVRPADSFPFAYALGLITMAFNIQFKRIGDWAAGTIVVYDQVETINQFSAAKQSRAPSFSLSTEEQQTIIAFAEQSQYLSEARQAELANILAPLLNTEGKQASVKLKQIAQYYLGQEI